MRATIPVRMRWAAYAVVTCGLLFGAPLAEATSTARISAVADWTTLQVTVAGLPPAYDSQGTIAQATAGYDDSGVPMDQQAASGWGNLAAEVTAFNVQGRVSTSSAEMRVEGTAVADGLNNTYGRGKGFAYRIGYFPVNTNGTIQATITFNLSQVFQYVPATDNVGGYSEFNIGISRVNPVTGVTETIARTSDTFVHYSGSANQNGTWTDTRTLTVSVAGEAGFRYAVDVSAQADGSAGTPTVRLPPSQIPLSPLLPLLLSGVIGVGALLGRYRR